jgi:hypothetical protein
MAVPDIHISELVQCAERELRQRHYVYPRRVESGKMSKDKMNHEIRAMEQIITLLRAEEKKGMLL